MEISPENSVAFDTDEFKETLELAMEARDLPPVIDIDPADLGGHSIPEDYMSFVAFVRLRYDSEKYFSFLHRYHAVIEIWFSKEFAKRVLAKRADEETMMKAVADAGAVMPLSKRGQLSRPELWRRVGL